MIVDVLVVSSLGVQEIDFLFTKLVNPFMISLQMGIVAILF